MMMARPPPGTIRVERIRNMVVLPLPLGPSSPNSSAGRTSNETPLRALRQSYRWTRSWTDITAGVAASRLLWALVATQAGALETTGYSILTAPLSRALGLDGSLDYAQGRLPPLPAQASVHTSMSSPHAGGTPRATKKPQRYKLLLSIIRENNSGK